VTKGWNITFKRIFILIICRNLSKYKLYFFWFLFTFWWLLYFVFWWISLYNLHIILRHTLFWIFITLFAGLEYTFWEYCHFLHWKLITCFGSDWFSGRVSILALKIFHLQFPKLSIYCSYSGLENFWLEYYFLCILIIAWACSHASVTWMLLAERRTGHHLACEKSLAPTI